MSTSPADRGDARHDRASIALDDRVVVVTGAAAGIGRATALLMAEFGATVAMCDRDADGLATVAKDVEANGALGPTAVLDVRDAEAVDEFLAAVVAGSGRIDVLVNNAGGTFFAPFLEVSARGEAALIAENFTQVTHLIRATVAVMPDRGGSIVNITSIEAHQAAPGFAVYGAMKTAVASLTRSLALELAPRRIRVNAVAPDAIPTAGDDELQDQLRGSADAFDPAVVPPLGYLGRPDDAAAVALFLAGDLSRFVTGTTIHVDGGNWAAGGWHRVPPRRED
jgi:NAD(P)-dependent dehydrogenase (short-subunit alcohol dehydrogenase family)